MVNQNRLSEDEFWEIFDNENPELGMDYCNYQI